MKLTKKDIQSVSKSVDKMLGTIVNLVVPPMLVVMIVWLAFNL